MMLPQSPALVLRAAVRRGAATEIRARKLYFGAMAAFRSNLLDAADLTPAFREHLLAFLRQVDAMAPTQAEWDEAMAQTPETRQEMRDLQDVGSGRALL
jgi:hypothetical protein